MPMWSLIVVPIPDVEAKRLKAIKNAKRNILKAKNTFRAFIFVEIGN